MARKKTPRPSTVVARNSDDVVKTSVTEDEVPNTVGVEVAESKSTSLETSSPDVQSSGEVFKEETSETVTDKVTIEEVVVEEKVVTTPPVEEVVVEEKVVTTPPVEEVVVEEKVVTTPPVEEVVVEEKVVTTPPVEEVVVEEKVVTTPPVEETKIEKPIKRVSVKSVTETNTLDLNDHVIATVRGVIGRSGRGDYSIQELLRFQFVYPTCQIILAYHLKRPFLKLLKTVTSVEKLPSISNSIRSNAVRRFSTVNNISIIAN